jgi:hypothetical protein
MATPKIFISATSADLGTVRHSVKEALLAIGCMPVEQRNLPPDYRKLVDFLKTTIAQCDAVIHIAGTRYGYEPDPSSLPTGVERRSYTQMEYEFAQELRKRTYSFVCSEDFPYDPVPGPESEDKQELQARHRARLVKSGYKYQSVRDKHAVELRTREIREHIDQIRRLMDEDRRRHSRAWAATALLLVALTAIAWLTYRKVVAGAGESKAVLKYLRDVNVIDDVAKSAGLDRNTVEGLVNLAREADMKPMAYARKMGAEGRKAEAMSLALVVAEALLLHQERSNFEEAAQALVFAARMRHSLAAAQGKRADVSKGMLEASDYLQRALDTLDATLQSKAATPQAFEIISLRAEWMSEAGDSADLAAARNIHQEVLAISEQEASRFVGHRGLQAGALLLAANARQTWAIYLHEGEAKTALAKAISEIDAALPELDAEGRAEDWHNAVRLRTAAVRDLVERTTEAEGHILVDGVRRLVHEALTREDGKQLSETHDRTELNFADILLWLAENPRSEGEERQAIEEAKRIYQQVFERQSTNWESNTKVLAAYGLVHAACAAGDSATARKFLEQVQAAGQLNGFRAMLEIARYAVAYAIENEGYFGSELLLRDAKKDIASMLVDFPMDLVPDANIRLRLAAAAVSHQMAYLPRMTDEQAEALGLPLENMRLALQELSIVAAACPKEAAPKSWANARLQSGVYRLLFRIRKGTEALFNAMAVESTANVPATLDAFEDSLTVFTKESYPTQHELAQQGIERLSNYE